jgi:hypothetical protein
VSSVTFPANDLAQVEEVKSWRRAMAAESRAERELNLLLSDITLHSALAELKRLTR